MILYFSENTVYAGCMRTLCELDIREHMNKHTFFQRHTLFKTTSHSNFRNSFLSLSQTSPTTFWYQMNDTTASMLAAWLPSTTGGLQVAVKDRTYRLIQKNTEATYFSAVAESRLDWQVSAAVVAGQQRPTQFAAMRRIWKLDLQKWNVTTSRDWWAKN